MGRASESPIGNSKLQRKHPGALILFAKDPVLGQVKTRLQPALDRETTLDLYRCFLADSIEKICSVAGVDRYVEVASSEVSEYFARIARDSRISDVSLQSGKDLGEKMRHALGKYLDAGYERVVLIGSDSPSLPASYIQQAFQSGGDLVIGPSIDGGYYLIGMMRQLTEIFSGVTWGSGSVLEETLERVEACGRSLELLPVWYDVDRIEELRFLKTHLQALSLSGKSDAAVTGKFLKQLF